MAKQLASETYRISVNKYKANRFALDKLELIITRKESCAKVGVDTAENVFFLWGETSFE